VVASSQLTLAKYTFTHQICSKEHLSLSQIWYVLLCAFSLLCSADRIQSTTKQRLALAIIDFLNTSVTDGTLTEEDRESIEVATSCISESFKVDATDKSAVEAAIGGQNLLQIYGVYEKLKGKTAAGPGTNAAGEKAAPAAAPTEEQKKEAEALKSQGNAAMAQKDYPAAIDFYTKALAIIPGNPIFLSNRAAAYSASKDHASAKADAEAAVATDPKYTKAWSRLGLANFALGDAKGSMEAYQKGIEHEGNGGSDAMKKGYETAKKRVAELEAGDDDVGLPAERGTGGGAAGAGGMPDLSSLAGMFGGGGGAGGGGMPDLSSIMSNPMFASMAQNLMSNPDMMNNIMSNPRLREMASQFGGGGGGGAGGAGGQGGGMPDLSSLMQDPSIAEM
jgi:small glutamine-rich tetratricopeptide repeat-containing protein alpha